MDDASRSLKLKGTLPVKTEVEPQVGGPQSGFPPPYLVGQDLAPYLIVGIDFGSYHCRVCTFANGGPLSVQPHLYSSLVEDALQIPYTENDFVHSLKTLVSSGRSVRHANQIYNNAQLLQKMFQQLKGTVESSTQRLLAKAVISVPACFHHRQRKFLIDSAQAASIDVLGLINEPTAAALDACFRQNIANGRYLVVSCGVYTFEASVVHIQNKLIETKSAQGNVYLSANSLNIALAEAMELDWGITTPGIHIEIEKAKKELDRKQISYLKINNKHYELTRELATQWLSSYAAEIELLVNSLLNAAQLETKEIDGVIFAGAGSQSWLLQETLIKMLKKPAIYWGNISSGAAIQAALLVRQTKDWVVWDAISCPVFAAQAEQVKQVITANSPLPIAGHALLHAAYDGFASSTIYQVSPDRSNDNLVQVATIKITDELAPVADEAELDAVVDLSVQVSSDGTLQFSARHRTLDVNLKVEVSEPLKDESEVLDLTLEKI